MLRLKGKLWSLLSCSIRCKLCFNFFSLREMKLTLLKLQGCSKSFEPWTSAINGWLMQWHWKCNTGSSLYSGLVLGFRFGLRSLTFYISVWDCRFFIESGDRYSIVAKYPRLHHQTLCSVLCNWRVRLTFWFWSLVRNDFILKNQLNLETV
jgi:hypothetical protein